jgi:hypothetical protein
MEEKNTGPQSVKSFIVSFVVAAAVSRVITIGH